MERAASEMAKSHQASLAAAKERYEQLQKQLDESEKKRESLELRLEVGEASVETLEHVIANQRADVARLSQENENLTGQLRLLSDGDGPVLKTSPIRASSSIEAGQHARQPYFVDFGRQFGADIEDGGVIAGVVPGSPAERQGVAPGDTLMGINAIPLNTLCHENSPSAARIVTAVSAMQAKLQEGQTLRAKVMPAQS